MHEARLKMISGGHTPDEEQLAVPSEITNNITQTAQVLNHINDNVAQRTMVVTDIIRDIAKINQESGPRAW